MFFISLCSTVSIFTLFYIHSNLDIVLIHYLERQQSVSLCWFIILYSCLVIRLFSRFCCFPLFSIVFLWVPKFLFIFFRRISLGYNHRSRISRSKLWTILKVLFYSNLFLLRKTEPIFSAKSNMQLYTFSHSLVNTNFEHIFITYTLFC